MRLKHIKDAEIIVGESEYVINNPKENINNWNACFNNTNKIELEIGCGKGDFLIKKAKYNPNINYIGVEKYASALIFAIKKLENENIPNLKFIVMDAIEIDKVFNKEISKLYLNFSDPWPKKRHEKRRLTSDVFLNKYKRIFKGLKVIEQKTDNDSLYKYSLKQYIKNGYLILKNKKRFSSLKI